MKICFICGKKYKCSEPDIILTILGTINAYYYTYFHEKYIGRHAKETKNKHKISNETHFSFLVVLCIRIRPFQIDPFWNVFVLQE